MESSKTWITNGNQEDLVEMNVRIDNELFQQLKNQRIQQFKVKYPSRTFKYNKYPFVLFDTFTSDQFSYLFSLTFSFYQFLSHKIYRLLIKKLRRQFLRQRNAKERDDKLRCEEIQRENDPLHQAWILHRENLRRQREIEEEQAKYD